MEALFSPGRSLCGNGVLYAAVRKFLTADSRFLYYGASIRQEYISPGRMTKRTQGIRVTRWNRRKFSTSVTSQNDALQQQIKTELEDGIHLVSQRHCVICTGQYFNGMNGYTTQEGAAAGDVERYVVCLPPNMQLYPNSIVLIRSGSLQSAASVILSDGSTCKFWCHCSISTRCISQK